MKRIILSLAIIASLVVAVTPADARLQTKREAIESTVADYVAPLLQPTFDRVTITTKRCHRYLSTPWTACRVIAKGKSRCSIVAHVRPVGHGKAWGVWLPRMSCHPIRRSTSR